MWFIFWAAGLFTALAGSLVPELLTSATFYPINWGIAIVSAVTGFVLLALGFILAKRPEKEILHCKSISFFDPLTETRYTFDVSSLRIQSFNIERKKEDGEE